MRPASRRYRGNLFDFLGRIACTVECKNATYYYRCSVVCVTVCVLDNSELCQDG